MRLETEILSNLIFDEEYARKVIAFLREDYFLDVEHRTVFASIAEHFQKYNACPSKNALLISLKTIEKLLKTCMPSRKNLSMDCLMSLLI